ncbi:hypothetical protein CYQ88_10300 [Hydrogenovibrio sp. SC-1]|nr:hypothetical protein CYQ88_10300 [Hydrogenovibrio sp. SC-1]
MSFHTVFFYKLGTFKQFSSLIAFLYQIYFIEFQADSLDRVAIMIKANQPKKTIYLVRLH